MRVSYYCQHVLGIGHLRRSLEICKTLAENHETTLILGGPPVSVDTSGLTLLQLPGLQMDSEFNNLTPCDNNQSLGSTKECRQKLLYSHFETTAPECFITELYPFGRKAFRFELDPVLMAISKGTLPTCQCLCSVRDILVEKQEGKEKFESRVVKTLNDYYDAVLVHADAAVVTLDETFTLVKEITIPVQYTGFVSEKVSTKSVGTIRKKLGLDKKQKLIIASSGGGGVGAELLHAVLPAFRKLLEHEPESHLQIFTGPYCTKDDFELLKNQSQKNITVDRFTSNFPDWLVEADLSISMAGYNTCMNLLQTEVPALVLPFSQNREQSLRVEKLREKSAIRTLSENDLSSDRLSKLMAEQLKRPPIHNTINLSGAANSRTIIDNILGQ
ncbi:glycosyltransferase family protein [Desulforhopalus sp. 52FAK]